MRLYTTMCDTSFNIKSYKIICKTYLFSALNSASQHAMPSEFSGKLGTEFSYFIIVMLINYY